MLAPKRRAHDRTKLLVVAAEHRCAAYACKGEGQHLFRLECLRCLVHKHMREVTHEHSPLALVEPIDIEPLDLRRLVRCFRAGARPKTLCRRLLSLSKQPGEGLQGAREDAHPLILPLKVPSFLLVRSARWLERRLERLDFVVGMLSVGIRLDHPRSVVLLHKRRLEHLGRLGHEGQARLIKKVRGAARGHDHVKLEELLEGGHREIADLEVLLTVLEQRRRDRVQSSLHGVQAQHRGWTRQFAPAREHA